MKSAYDYSIQLLSKKDYSIFKLTNKLIKKEYDQDEIQETISKLLELRYLREDSYRKNLIKSLLERGYIDNYIIQKLRQEELYTDTEEILLVKNELGTNSSEIARRLIEQKLKYTKIPDRTEDKFKLKNKLLSFLVSKGFNFDDVNELINQKINYEDQY